MTGTLIKVYKAGPGTALTAVIGVSGQLDMKRAGSCAFNAHIYFTFEPPLAPAPATGAVAKATGSRAGAARRTEGIEDARGQIDQVLMALTADNDLRGSDGRLKEHLTKEVFLQRRPFVSAPNPAAGSAPVPPLDLPQTAPVADEANSWLTYDDSMGRFHFRHPQELTLALGGPMDVNAVELVDPQMSGTDALWIHLEPNTGGPDLTRAKRDPENRRRELYATWEKTKQDVIPGSADWLPKAEWAPLKREVYRIEAALRRDFDPPRVYTDWYLVLFDGRKETIVVEAMTVQDPHQNFRKKAENVIRSFAFGPAEPRAKPVPAAAETKPAATKN
jgi:hypothetical protein